MHDLRFASLALCLSLGMACTPQTVINSSVPAAGTPARGITVNGSGKAIGRPNLARTNIGVETQAATAEQASAEVNSRMNQVIAAIKQAGVADGDVRTASLSLQFERVNDGPRPLDATSVPVASAPAGPPPTKPKPAAPSKPDPAAVAPTVKLPHSQEVWGLQGFYRASNSVEVTVRNLDNVGKVLSAATSAGANQVFGIRFELDDPAQLQAEARKRAMADARQRAERLAQLAGVKLGPAVAISESDNGGGSGPMPAYAMMKSDGAAPVERGEITVSSTVQVVYALGE
jgi:uncharacterized protein YggE